MGTRCGMWRSSSAWRDLPFNDGCVFIVMADCDDCGHAPLRDVRRRFQDNSVVSPCRGSNAPPPIPGPLVTTEPASAAYERVLKDAGATQPHRDPVDERI